AMDEFRLGLSDASGQQVVQRLHKFGPELLETSGLVVKRQEGTGFYDRFRARLMFPIHNESGKVIAFGGRALRANDEPKYLNSPETKIYKKSSVLYNLHRAKIDARKHDRMILVEGYMDVIGVYMAGIKEVVASCGTSLSLDQVRTIKRQTAQQQANSGQVILNFDPDAAGQRSAEKYIGAFLSEGLRVRVLELPGGLDPDEYIHTNGAEAYADQLNRASSYFHWLASRARERFDMRTVEGRVDAFRSILPAIQLVHDRVERSAVANEISDYLKLDRAIVAEQLRNLKRPNGTARKSAPATSTLPPNEVLLLTCFLLSPDAREAIKHYLASRDVLELLETRAIFRAVLSMEADGQPFSMSAVAERLDPHWQAVLSDLSFRDLGIAEDHAVAQALHCLQSLERKAANAQFSNLKSRIRELEDKGDVAGAFLLIQELERLKSPHFGE
ncbi:MAG: toprim domain-containing protein, partial [Acidobacteriaceae bacterium]|nr:toprim domain-containing protein [Acidobacteriaceae bacterium]